jgi:hypothetical protein
LPGSFGYEDPAFLLPEIKKRLVKQNQTNSQKQIKTNFKFKGDYNNEQLSF